MENKFKGFFCAAALLVLPVSGSAAAYDDDETNFFVSGSGANEALSLVNQIVCFMKNTRAEEFVNDGVFRATIYADDCVTTSADSSSADSAKPKSSSASGGDKQGATTEQKTASTAILRVTRADSSSPVLSKGWMALTQNEDMGNGQMVETKIDVYMDLVQTAGVSSEAPQGEWTMRYSLSAGADIPMGPGFTLPAGSPMGIGYIDAKGKSLRFKDNGVQGSGNVVANFSDNGDIEGIYLESVFMDDGQGGGNELYVQNAFVVDAAEKIFCKKMYKAEVIDFSDLDQETFAPARTEYTPTTGDGLTTDETCYSTDVTKAYRNVWRYGVYDANGDRYELSNQAFPMKALINEGTANEKEVFAYAGYWGVHVDPESISNVTDSLVFEREDFVGDSNATAPTYTLKQKNLRLEKRTKEYVALNSLDGMTIGFNMAQDSYWTNELTSLNAGLADSSTYDEYEGTFRAATQTFSFTEGVTFYPNYSKETLSTPISFSVSDWLSKMKKIIGQGEDWEFTEFANMHVYSHDTQQGYSINEKAMNNPDDGTAPTDDNDTSAGVASDVTSVVKDFSEIAAGLRCLSECPTSSLLAATYGDALGKAQSANGQGITEASPSPFAPAGPYVTEQKTVTINYCAEGVDEDYCKEQRTYQVGDWVDGLIASEITEYAVIDGVITESGQPISTGVTSTILSLMGDGTIRDSRDLFDGAKALIPEGQQSRELDLSWGVMSGPLVLASDLPKLECTKNQDTGEYEGETPPEFTDAEAAETRYCLDKLWSNKSLTTYNFVFELQPSFEIYDSGGNTVAFDPPKMLYFSVPDNATLYREDAGKSLRLEYGGFGNLHGIPGNVIDINTGENLGQYFDGDWKSNYRYLSRFIIPSGSELTDKASGLSYKVKALNGEEYLSLAPEALGTVTYTSTSDDLIPDSLMIDVGPNGGDNFIGIKPAKSEMINGGEPSVIHGKVLFDPSSD